MEPLKIFKGEDVSIPFKIRGKISQDPVDLTGKILTASFTGCPAPVLIPTTDITILNAVLGKGVIKLSDTQTKLLKSGAQSFRVIITENPGPAEITRICEFQNQIEVEG